MTTIPRYAAAPRVDSAHWRRPEAAWCLVGALHAELLPADRVLEQLGHPFAVHVLLDAFHVSELAAIRGDIADALGLARALPALHAIASLIRFGTERERIKACRALGRLARVEAVPLLLEALEDEAWVVRAQAALALGRIGDGRAVRPLEQALTDTAWWVRADAAEALRACGEPGREALRRAVVGGRTGSRAIARARRSRSRQRSRPLAATCLFGRSRDRPRVRPARRQPRHRSRTSRP